MRATSAARGNNRVPFRAARARAGRKMPVYVAKGESKSCEKYAAYN